MHGSTRSSDFWSERRMLRFALEQPRGLESQEPMNVEGKTAKILQGVLRFLEALSGAHGGQAVNHTLEQRGMPMRWNVSDQQSLSADPGQHTSFGLQPEMTPSLPSQPQTPLRVRRPTTPRTKIPNVPTQTTPERLSSPPQQPQTQPQPKPQTQPQPKPQTQPQPKPQTQPQPKPQTQPQPQEAPQEDLSKTAEGRMLLELIAGNNDPTSVATVSATPLKRMNMESLDLSCNLTLTTKRVGSTEATAIAERIQHDLKKRGVAVAWQGHTVAIVNANYATMVHVDNALFLVKSQESSRARLEQKLQTIMPEGWSNGAIRVRFDGTYVLSATRASDAIVNPSFGLTTSGNTVESNPLDYFAMEALITNIGNARTSSRPEPKRQPQAEQPKPQPEVQPAQETLNRPQREPRRPEQREEVESADPRTRDEVIAEVRTLSAGPTALAYISTLDSRVQGDYGPILEGITRLRTVVASLTTDEQAVLKESAHLTIFPKGALHSFSGSEVGIDVTQPADTLKGLLQRELRPMLFARDVQGKLRAEGFAFRRVTLDAFRMSGMESAAVSSKIANAFRRVPEAARRTMTLGWLYITNGDQQHQILNGSIYTLNVSESEDHIAAFLTRMLTGLDPGASSTDVNANIEARRALDDAVATLRGDRYVSYMSTVSSSVIRDFADIQAGITRFRALRNTLSPAQQSALTDMRLTVQPKGSGSSCRGGELSVDMTISDAAMRALLEPELVRMIYAKETRTALEGRGFSLIALYAEQTISGKTPAESATLIANAVDALGSPIKERVRSGVSSMYVTNAGDAVQSLNNNGILTINVTKTAAELTAALRPLYRTRGIDHLYDRVPNPRAVALNRDMTQWLDRQRSLRDRRTTPPTLNQNFPVEYRSQLQSSPGITLANVGGSGAVDITFASAVRYGSESVSTWSLASDIHVNTETGTADEVYLYPKDKPKEGILLQCSVLFSQDGRLDPVRLRRFAALALEHNASERDDPANIRTYEIAGRADKIACINLVDDTNEAARGLGQSAEAFTTLLNGRYTRKFGANADRLTSQTMALGARDNPLTALTQSVDAAVAGGRKVIVINLAAHGDSTSAQYAAGNLRATDVLALMQRHTDVRFTLFAPSCFGAGFEDAMRDLTDSGGAEGRITVFHQAKQDSTNLATRASDADPYTTLYDAALHMLLSDPANDSRSFGELHQEADRIARTRSLRNAGVWRSGGSGPSRRTARLEDRRSPDTASA